MGLGVPPLDIKIMPESNPVKSRKYGDWLAVRIYAVSCLEAQSGKQNRHQGLELFKWCRWRRGKIGQTKCPVDNLKTCANQTLQIREPGRQEFAVHVQTAFCQLFGLTQSCSIQEAPGIPIICELSRSLAANVSPTEVAEIS